MSTNGDCIKIEYLTMRHYSAMKMKELRHAATWINCKISSKRSKKGVDNV